MVGWRHKAWHFDYAPLAESTWELNNPACGWYRIYTIRLEESAEEQIAQWYLDASEPLALLRVDIGAYRSRALDAFAQEQLRQVMQVFHASQTELILRPLYDTQGRGLEREPVTLERICGHVRQLFQVLQEFEDDIYIVQGILLGSWGEMHGSRFLKKDSICTLMQLLERLSGPDTFLAVRRPMFYRMLRPASRWMDEGKIGLYDDAILGSDTDLGTFGWQNSGSAGWEGAWLPAQELEFERRLCSRVPQGGEMLYWESGSRTLETVEVRLRKMHVSYLNSQHDENALAHLRQWKHPSSGIWKDMNGFDYIGRHLGYRYCVRGVSVRADTKAGELRVCVQIENVGFAPCYQPVVLSLVLLCASGEKRAQDFSADLRKLDGGRKTRLVCTLPLRSGELYLQLHRRRDGRMIFFATEAPGNTENGLLLGTVHGG